MLYLLTLQESIWLHYFHGSMEMLLHKQISVHVDGIRWRSFSASISYLQCWCVWYSWPPPPEFPAVVYGSLRYQPPWGAAAGCEGWGLSISRYGPWLLLHHRPSSSLCPPTLELKINVALLAFQHTAPLTTTYLITPSAKNQDKFWGSRNLSKGLKCLTTPESGFPLPAAVLCVPQRAKYKSPIEWEALI